MNAQKITTHDLADFGARERHMASELLAAWNRDGLPEHMGDGVRVWMNMQSGYVFLSDEDYNVAMMNGDELQMFWSCPNCGHEGFADEMREEGEDCCRSFLADAGAA